MRAAAVVKADWREPAEVLAAFAIGRAETDAEAEQLAAQARVWLDEASPPAARGQPYLTRRRHPHKGLPRSCRCSYWRAKGRPDGWTQMEDAA